jgi:hypothetical protein
MSRPEKVNSEERVPVATQKARVLDHLKKWGAITPLSALKWYGCYRLASRINELRKEGHIILTKKHFGRYHAVYQYHGERSLDNGKVCDQNRE